MNLPEDSFIFAYIGQLIERKNMDFLLRTYAKTFTYKKIYLLVLGGGAQLEELKAKYGDKVNIDFRGNVMNVNHYLKASDAYIGQLSGCRQVWSQSGGRSEGCQAEQSGH